VSVIVVEVMAWSQGMFVSPCFPTVCEVVNQAYSAIG